MELNSDQVLDALNEIAAVSSRNEKQALVTKYAKAPLFEYVLQMAYNPFINFGISPAKDAKGTGVERFNATLDSENYGIPNVLVLLEALQKRELTGNAARASLTEVLARLTEKSGDLLVRILRKDLRAGFSESTCNKAVKGLIPEFPYMRCCLPKDAKLNSFTWDTGVISQEKADGMFANGTLIKHEDEAPTFSFQSRQGSVFPMHEFADLVSEAVKILKPNMQYHGELLVECAGQVLAREVSNGILNSVLQGGSFDEGFRPVYFIWDAIPIEFVKPKGKYMLAYINRIQEVVSLTKNNKTGMVRHIPTRVCRSLEQCYAHYREMLAQGKEGTVIKNATAIWRDGTSKEQVKLKLEADCELEVKAIVEGRVGSKNEGRAGSLTCESACGLLRVDVAVKNEAMRDAVDAANDDWIGRIITVRSNLVLKPSASNDMHSMFLPRMVEAAYRTDKTEADCLERITAQFDNAMKAV